MTFPPDIFQKINVYNLKSYKFFFILQNLKRNNSKYESLLKNIISEPLFLIYVYKAILDRKNHIAFKDLSHKAVLKEINAN